MTIERGLRLVADMVLLVSVCLGYPLQLHLSLLAAFAGLNPLQSAFTYSRPMVYMLAWMGLQPCHPTNNPREC